MVRGKRSAEERSRQHGLPQPSVCPAVEDVTIVPRWLRDYPPDLASREPDDFSRDSASLDDQYSAPSGVKNLAHASPFIQATRRLRVTGAYAESHSHALCGY